MGWQHRHGRAGSIPVLVVALVLAAGCAQPSPSPAGSPMVDPGSGPSTSEPPASPGDGIRQVGTPDAGGWTAVELGELAPPIVLEPVTAGAAAVAPDTEFRLRSLDGRAPADLARSLVAQPPVEFQVVSVAGDTAIVRPAGGLSPGSSYTIALTRSDGTTEASWTAQAAGPLQVTDTVPGDAATKVPLDTGIEITFDQYGVAAADVATHFTIAPAVHGRFEVLGRSAVFVPDRPLDKGRLYTVTISRGLPLPGTGQVLEADHVVRFETAATVPSPFTAWFHGDVVDSSTTGDVRIPMGFDVRKRRDVPSSLPITVHRVDGVRAAIAAWRAIAAAPEWTRVSTTEPVSTAGLHREFAGTVDLARLGEWNTRVLTVPVRLAAGWYVVTERWAGIPRQVLVQVSDLATFALVATDRTAVWVNDPSTGRAVAEAAVSVGGHDLGTTDARGLLVAGTPRAVTRGDADDAAVLIVRRGSQTAFFGTGIGGADAVGGIDEEGAWYEDAWTAGDDDWWRLLYTDRETYRTNDTINAWGMARPRDGGRPPASVTLELRADRLAASPVATSATAETDANGAFSASLPVRDLPYGSYQVVLVIDGDTIAESWLEVGVITKPAWQMELTADRRALISGDQVTTTVRTWFYEGTPVAGARINLEAYAPGSGNASARLTTDADGRGRHTFTFTARSSCQPCWAGVDAYPRVPEEAEIGASTSVDLFAASAIVDARGTLAGHRLQIGGKVSDVDLSRYEQAPPDAEVDARGAGRPQAQVRVRVVEHWTIERRTGSRYDPIEKKVVPVYETVSRQRLVADRTALTRRDGIYALDIEVRGGQRSYEIDAAYVDEEGRTTRTTDWANRTRDDDEDWEGHEVHLVYAGSSRRDDGYGIGETVRVRLAGGTTDAPVERYLYAVAQRGLRYATVGTTPTFRTTFERDSLPVLWITGVRFTGSRYETAVSGYEATTRLADRALRVEVTPDAGRYAPGETASVSIRTLGADGSPVRASVYVKAVDEKLYTIGAASDPTLPDELYQSVGDGVLATVISHRPVEETLLYGFEGGDTTGGGGYEREDFRDWLLATLVTTNRAGRATVQVPLSDDLTSWRVVASAVDGSLHAGTGTASLVVGLPFFAEATLKDEYLVADRPVLRVRAYGTALGDRDMVTYTVSSDSLPMAPVTARGRAFEAVEVPLALLTLGTHRVRIEARAGGGRSDTLIRTFKVVETRGVRRSTTWAPLEHATSVGSSAGSTFTYLTLVDAGRGRVIPALYDLAWQDGVRSDQRLAAALAGRILAGDLGLEAAPERSSSDLDPFWRPHGLALVAHGSSQLEVTALAAMTDDPRLDREMLREALEKVAFDPDQRRERRLVALAGLAGLGDPVLGEVRAAAREPDLALEEQVTLALAALHAGDEALAGTLERGVLEEHGRLRGEWLRVDAGSLEDDAVQTARLAIVSASLGLPFAARMDAWLEANPPRTTLVVLERALAARGWVRRVAGAQATAALSIDGRRREVEVQPGAPVVIPLTPAQAASSRLEPLSGSILAVTQRDVPLGTGAFTAPQGVTVSRSVSPAGTIGLTDTVIVTISVELDPSARREPWSLVDWVPSGLTATTGGSWRGSQSREVIGPDAVIGQRVEFRFGESSQTGTWLLRYVARVVTPGSYRWEPAVLQSAVEPDEGILLPASRIRIAGLDSQAETGSPARPASPGAPTPSPVAVPTPRPTPSPSPTPMPSGPAWTPSPAPSGPPTPGPTAT